MESVSASEGNPKEQRTMKQETGRPQPGIPSLQGGEDANGIKNLISTISAIQKGATS